MKLPNGNKCDICGKPRGNSGIDHSACSAARKAKGGEAPEPVVNRNSQA